MYLKQLLYSYYIFEFVQFYLLFYIQEADIYLQIVVIIEVSLIL